MQGHSNGVRATWQVYSQCIKGHTMNEVHIVLIALLLRKEIRRGDVLDQQYKDDKKETDRLD